MRERITTIMEMENLSPTKFAELLKIQPSNISHLLSGRNKPSFELLEKIMVTFPHISGDWLITGLGNYRKFVVNEPKEVVMPQKNSVVPSLFDQISPQKVNEDTIDELKSINPLHSLQLEPTVSIQPESIKLPSSCPPKVCKIVLVYDDNTFEELNPKATK